MDSGSISSAKLGYWSICVIRGIPYDDLAASAGLEPAPIALTGRCSGRLELRSHMVSRAGLEPARFSVVGLRPTAIAAMPPADNWSGWRDSNSRPSGPRPDALRKLSYAPKLVLQTGVEPALNGFSFRFLCQNWDTGAYLEQHTGLQPVPPVWKTGMLGHYTNATHSGSSLSREHLSQGGPPFSAVDPL